MKKNSSKYFFNRDNLNEDSKIYRFMKINYCIELFKKREFVFVKPTKWEDPFEHFIIKKLKSNKLKPLENRFYGQCWTAERETDAIWRIYCHDKMSIRIRTTSKKLCESISGKVPFILIGNVVYYNDSNISMVMNSSFVKDIKNDGEIIQNSLLIKRLEFKHENEIRAIIDTKTCSNPNDIKKINVNPFKLVEEITFHPQMNLEMVKIFKNHFQSIGFTGKINQSQLYKLL